MHHRARTSTRTLLLALAAGLSISIGSTAKATASGADSGPAQPRVLELRVGAIDTALRANLLNAVGANAAPVAQGSRYVLQLDGSLTAARESALTKAGITLGQYLPEHAYIVALENLTPVALAQLVNQPGSAIGFVSWLGAYDNAWKLDPEINNRAYRTEHRQELAARGLAEVTVLCFDDADTRPAINEITRLGGEVRGVNPQGDQWAIDATMKAADVAALALLDTVQFIEDGPEATLRNDSNRWILQSNVANQTPIWNKGIRGEGQVGGLIDGTMNESHCMFDDSVPVGPSHRKVLAIRSAGGADVHGTHTAGTLAGDAAPLGTYTAHDGIAFAAKLSFTNLGAISGSGTSLALRLQDAHNDGARVHSNSWGDDGTTSYTNWCRQIDLFTAANEDSLVAFAVSNGATAKTPENSVNVLGVGASQDTPNQANHCSGGTGPTADGRRKPEVYAPGCGTVSANSNSTCGVTALTGTSMACPAVSGAGLLVRQYFTEGWYPSGNKSSSDALTPSGALLKAVLVNTSVDMTGISGYPSNREGWGRVLLDNSLFFAGDARKLFVRDVRNGVGLTTGQFTEYTFNVTSSGVPLEITLASTHPAAAVGAANPIINNLDLEVVDPFGTLYKGNVFTGVQSSTGGTADAKNNVERVIRTTPALGVYTVRVRGTAVNSAGVKQGYAVVATGDLRIACPADFDGNGFVNGEDFDQYVAAFEAGLLAADFDEDGFVTGEDFDAYALAFGAGC